MEFRNGEKQHKSPNSRRKLVQISPRVHEKETAKDLLDSYQELAQVPLDEQSKT